METPIESLFLARVHAAAQKNANWILFYGIVTIIGGVVNIPMLGLGLLYVWMGVLLVQAANAVKKAGPAGLRPYVAKIGLYFRVTAIATIVMMVLLLIGIAVVLSLGSLHIPREAFELFS